MFKNSFSIGKIGGVEIRIDYSWFVIFVMVFWLLGASVFPAEYPDWTTFLTFATAFFATILFFFSVLAHELAHSFVTIATGGDVKDITLFLFGGAAQIKDEPDKPGKEFWMALVGPLTSIALGLIFLLLLRPAFRSIEPLAALFLWLGRINLLLAVFNLIPGFPLDGGRVLRAVIWKYSNNFIKATKISSTVGKAVAYTFIFLGIFRVMGGDLGGLWIAFIGWFLSNAAAVSYRQVAIIDALQGFRVGSIMETDCPAVPGNLKLGEFVHDYLLRSARRCFPVIEDERLLGLMTIHALKRYPRQEWDNISVMEAMIPREKLFSGSSEDDLSEVFKRLSQKDVNQLVITDGDRFAGMLSRERLLFFLRTRAELGI